MTMPIAALFYQGLLTAKSWKESPARKTSANSTLESAWLHCLAVRNSWRSHIFRRKRFACFALGDCCRSIPSSLLWIPAHPGDLLGTGHRRWRYLRVQGHLLPHYQGEKMRAMADAIRLFAGVNQTWGGHYSRYSSRWFTWVISHDITVMLWIHIFTLYNIVCISILISTCCGDIHYHCQHLPLHYHLLRLNMYWCIVSILLYIILIRHGQIIATSHDLTWKDSWGREIPLFQKNLGWWRIRIWPDWNAFVCVHISTSNQ